MNLSKKTFLYSAIISLIMVSFMITYFVLMLPSLYVDYVNRNNLKSISTIHQQYVATGSYEKISLKNPSGTFSIRVPKNGYDIYGTNIFGTVKVSLHNSLLKELLDSVRNFEYNTDSVDSKAKEDLIDTFSNTNFTNLFEEIFSFNDQGLDEKTAPLTFEVQNFTPISIYDGEMMEFHSIDKNTFVMEASVTAGNSYYTNYFALTKGSSDYYISYLPVMTPNMNEITPIVLGSIPMFLAVGFLLIFLSTLIFSRSIVGPITQVANQAEYIKHNLNKVHEPFSLKGKDEITKLSETLNELYSKLYDNYQELKEKNLFLARQSEQQEVFLRASSHQLKTPVAASLLLINSMIDEVGKYKDTKEYLPMVKKQLLIMQNIIEDILYLNQRAKHIELEIVKLETIVTECCNAFQFTLKEKNISINFQGGMDAVNTDPELIKTVIDSLLSNAVKYTPNDEKIDIMIKNKQLTITNYGVTIDKELLPNVFEPFVSSNHKEKGHGLGLYFVAYYGELLKYKPVIENLPNGVQITLTFQTA